MPKELTPILPLRWEFFFDWGHKKKAKSYFKVLNIFLRGKAPSRNSSGRSETKS